MADLKGKPEVKGNNYFSEMVMFLIALYFLWAIYEQASYYLGVWGYGDAPHLWARFVLYFMDHIWGIIQVVGILVSLLALVGVVHSVRKLNAVTKDEKEIYGESAKFSPIFEKGQPALVNTKWERVLEHSNSLVPSDWRLAIIEADIMLDDLVRAAGYHGDSLGERLKGVEKSDFLTIENAWEAHKIRNQIAHQGADFNLTDRETRRVISLFESVFKEFKII